MRFNISAKKHCPETHAVASEVFPLNSDDSLSRALRLYPRRYTDKDACHVQKDRRKFHAARCRKPALDTKASGIRYWVCIAPQHKDLAFHNAMPERRESAHSLRVQAKPLRVSSTLVLH
ncbi:MAG: hypothetical protein ACI8PP_003266 [Candidatus Pseudothioglobus sp.]|jgi:hypothetical protein